MQRRDKHWSIRSELGARRHLYLPERLAHASMAVVAADPARESDPTAAQRSSSLAMRFGAILIRRRFYCRAKSCKVGGKFSALKIRTVAHVFPENPKRVGRRRRIRLAISRVGEAIDASTRRRARWKDCSGEIVVELSNSDLVAASVCSSEVRRF